ncbi:uncharacterized protein H6S33_006444 [Morchella sextelata]|uniref:uncharacterized protein n=1 Tax=Morchella sextelata TaxID=1174677 RepID=UPI001D04CA18|nr:uncharacterized protein H6S33_006444 [Morchella sextelata]KAH0604776.1 hypothetical protein H6S33_006444 [Morchella sextelata]
MTTLRAPLLRLSTLPRGPAALPRIFHRLNSSDTPRTTPPPAPAPQPRTLDGFLGDSSTLSRTRIQRAAAAAETPEFPSFTGSDMFGGGGGTGAEDNMHHLNVYATKHNTHITFTKPNKDVILTLSCGNVGFKKANRGTFEAAYQLASVMFSRMEERGLRPKHLEVVYRDFGPGRDAFTKVLLGKEGKSIRESVVRVTDASRLKFGGTRSRAIRRL